MILKQFYEKSIAQASYIVGCPASGEACVIDPNRDFSQYLEFAAQENLIITAVTETHIHADFASGARELAKLTSAKLYLSDEGTADWKYAFAKNSHATLVQDGSEIMVGAAKLVVRKTPGHTPEHISFVLYDIAASDEPLAAFTGDFIFVGDVGRPDLLENAAGIVGTMEPGARDLFRSIEEFLKLPDHLMILPGHGAGSACGKNLGGVPFSTLGYEKHVNWALKSPSEAEFVHEVLMGQPEPPKYFAMMKKINKEGPAFVADHQFPSQPGTGKDIPHILSTNGFLIDARPTADQESNHIKGSVHIPFGTGFLNWAGWFTPYDRDIWVIARNKQEAMEIQRQLKLIGLDRFAGWFDSNAMAEFAKDGGELLGYENKLSSEIGSLPLLDVRNKSEWHTGHVEGATHISLGLLPERLKDLNPNEPIAIHCQGGVRSPIAACLLLNAGFAHVVNVTDGYVGLKKR